MYYKLGQLCFITNQGKRCYKLGQLHYYKLRQVLLQIKAGITNQGNRYYKIGQLLLNWAEMYYKLGQVLQIRAIITNWGITTTRFRSSLQYSKQKAFNQLKGFLTEMYFLNKVVIYPKHFISTGVKLFSLGKCLK